MSVQKSIVSKKILGSFALLAIAVSMSSQASDSYKPADFGQAKEYLSSKLTLPAAVSDAKSTIAVYCQADIPVTGVLSSAICFEMTETGLDEQTEDALQGVSFSPAEVNGQAVPVRMQFRVVLSGSGDQPELVLLPNLGTLQGQHGFDYFAPQERLDSTAWYDDYQGNKLGNGKVFFERGRLTRVIASVTQAGDVASVSTLDARGGSGKRDAATMERLLKNSRFIPGVVKNQVTEMHYVAVLNYAK